MLVYFLKIVLIQAIGLGIYFLLLRNQKIFGYARTFLWTVIVSAFVIPFIQIPVFEQVEIVSQINNLPQVIELSAITISENAPQFINWVLLLWIGVGVISLIQLVHLFFSYKKIIRLKKTATFTEPNIYASNSIQLPFSFVQSIYIPSSFIDKKELPFILAHEQAHIDKRHSKDKIIITLLARVFWFNPLFIIFHKELELIHEYQVDDSVTQNHKLEDYLKSLLQSSVYIQTSPIALTHSFFSSPIKNRIIMLHKKSRNKVLKSSVSFLSLSFVLLSFLFLQCQSNDGKVTSDGKYEEFVPDMGDTIYIENPATGELEMQIIEKVESLAIVDSVDIQAEYPGGEAAMINFLAENTTYPKEVKEKGISGTLYLQFVVLKDGSIGKITSMNTPEGMEQCETEAIRVVNKMPKWKPAELAGKKVNVHYVLPFQFQQ